MLVNYDDSEDEHIEEETAPAPDASKTLKIGSIQPDPSAEHQLKAADAAANRRVSGKTETRPAHASTNLSKRVPDIHSRHLNDSEDDLPSKQAFGYPLSQRSKLSLDTRQLPREIDPRTVTAQSTEEDLKKLVPSQIKLKRPNKPIEL